jgi:hypothetical protein
MGKETAGCLLLGQGIEISEDWSRKHWAISAVRIWSRVRSTPLKLRACNEWRHEECNQGARTMERRGEARIEKYQDCI